ncbi:MAG: protein ImuB [Oceanicoccus sp.]|jgi:protein ImuB
MWWLCIRFPSLMLDCIGIREAPNPATIVERQTVLQCNEAAFEQGIRVGQTIATALSLYPELAIEQRKPQKEIKLLETLAIWAYRFSPTVSIDTSVGALHIEVRGSLRLLHGFNRLYQHLTKGIELQRVHYYSGVAYNPSAAYLLSFGQYLPDYFRLSATQLDDKKVIEMIGILPVALLPCEEEIKKTLQSMGIMQLQALLQLPEMALKKRFGTDFHQYLKFIKGTEVELRTLFTPTEIFKKNLHFAGGLDNKQHLHHPIQTLLIELENYLRLRQLINRELEWEFHYINGEKDVLSVQSSHNFFQLSSLVELTLMRFEEFDMRSNVETLTLICEKFEKTTLSNNNLFEKKQDDFFFREEDKSEEKFSLLMDKLSSRLDEKLYYRLSNDDDHLPEKSWGKITYPEQKEHKERRDKPSLPRPLWLLSKPLEIQKHQNKLYWQGQLDLLQGPERIDTHWWKKHQVRDYYIAGHTNGSIIWIYKDKIDDRWFLHGMFS